MLKKYLITFFISMVPLIELRGAIPYAVSQGLNIYLSYIVAILGNMLPVPFIFLFARKVLVWGQNKKIIGKFFTFCLNKGEKGGKKLKEKTNIYLGLCLFVGIPIPGTGAWTGTLAASILDLDFKKSSVSIMLGVLLAGLIMSLGSKFVARFGWIGVIILLIIIILIYLAYHFISKKAKSKKSK